MPDALTLEQAEDIPLVDDTASPIVPYDQPAPEPDTFDEGEPDGLISGYDSALTLDEAADIELADDADVRRIAKTERPIANIEGQEVTLSELVNGFVSGVRLRLHADLVARQFLDVEDAAEKVAGAAWALAGIMSQQLPPAPDETLAHLNPMEYTRRKAVYDEAVAVVENTLSQGEQARHAAGVMAGQRYGATIQGELQKLAENFPNCATREGRAAFLDNVRDAVYSCGFSEDDMLQTIDHRMFRLAHLAAIGKQVQDRQEAPRPKKNRRRRHRRSEAMERLYQTGSIEDALAVDFD